MFDVFPVPSMASFPHLFFLVLFILIQAPQEPSIKSTSYKKISDFLCFCEIFNILPRDMRFHEKFNWKFTLWMSVLWLLPFAAII